MLPFSTSPHGKLLLTGEYFVLEGSAHSNMRDVPDIAAAAIIAFAKKVLN